jgi:NADH-quinone oxidoreductase subunit L
MFDILQNLWLIPVLPLAAAGVTAIFGPAYLRGQSHWPCIIASIGSCALSFLVLYGLITPHDVPEPIRLTWFQIGNVDITFSLRADGLTAVMLVTVTFISSLIAIFAVGYMHGDPGYPRFFAEISLFICSMTGLVLANNLFLLYAFWEGVGLCSYLLIGFWFAKPAAANAARKAFLVTRLGDLGFLLGILLLWVTAGHRLDLDRIFAQPIASWDHDTLTWICLLLFCGAVGKSAQFPLHVWLPDAMEGPTPVSALIHAATMVTAGVYLVARCTPLFEHSEQARVIVCSVGGITALLGALIALTQTDLKRVLAYSTISQLGYMFLALGSGSIVAAIFHLVTHAFFKALLFLSAGSVMHAMGGVIDMRRFGGLRKLMPITHATFLCGAAALAGVPLLSGFWSKDEILAGLDAAGSAGKPYSGIFLLMFIIGVTAAVLTAFYTTRAYVLTFLGEERIPEEAGHHAHESPPVMTYPLIALAVGAVGVGIVVEPFTHWITATLRTDMTGTLVGAVEHGMNYSAMGLGTLAAFAGIAAAWWMYRAQPGMPALLAHRFQGWYQLSLNKFYLDELYDAFIVRPLLGFAEFCRIGDLNVLDAIVDLVGELPGLMGRLFRPVQNGLVQFYALAMVLGLAVFLVFLATR